MPGARGARDGGLGFYPLPAPEHFPVAIVAYFSLAVGVFVFTIGLAFDGVFVRLAGITLTLMILSAPIVLIVGHEGGVLQRLVHFGSLAWIGFISVLALLEWREYTRLTGIAEALHQRAGVHRALTR